MKNILPSTSKMNRVEHTLDPIYNKHSKTLILGSMPSITSRAKMKYYGHPTNRFWSIMEQLYNCKIENWQKFILDHNLALWDVIESCDIDSSSDASIKNVKVNDIEKILRETEIQNIFVLGKTAFNLYKKYVYPKTKIEAICLSSPSSANASKKLVNLVDEYKIIKEKT